MKLLRPIKTLYEVWEDVDPGMTLTMIWLVSASVILFQLSCYFITNHHNFPRSSSPTYFPSRGNGSILLFPDAGNPGWDWDWRLRSKYFLNLRSSSPSSPDWSSFKAWSLWANISSEVSRPLKGLGLIIHKGWPSCPRYQNPYGISISEDLW